MQDKHDTAIDKTLAALTSAIPPEGMEARIQQRLLYRGMETTSARLPWRPARGWWLGMLTGAVAATLLCCAVLFMLRGHVAVKPNHAETAAKSSPATEFPAITPVSASSSATAPCARPAVIRQLPLHVQHTQTERPQAHGSEGLTPQEQQLVRLAHVANPQQLANLSFEARAQLDQQEIAAFQKFFTPPPPPQDPGVNE